MEKCPLCGSGKVAQLQLEEARDFYYCSRCFLISVPSCFWLKPEEEERRYQLHENTFENEGYLKFLSRAIDPALSLLHTGMKGLDFGCGPNPVLAALIEKEQIACDFYDPYFFPKLRQINFDFVFSTECIEHFFYPDKMFEQLYQLLKEGGYLILMTDMWQKLEDFENWYYKNDPAHVVFYHPNTFDYLASIFGYRLEYTDHKRVIIFKKDQERL